jgi:hypothetical protein
LIALVLVTMGVSGIVFEPLHKGVFLFAITDSHGVDTGDVPFIILLGVAAWLARHPG